jgi:transcriptional regulator with XRE-family HTH domain
MRKRDHGDLAICSDLRGLLDLYEHRINLRDQIVPPFKRLRRKFGINQEIICRKIGINRYDYSKWETQKTLLSGKKIIQVCEIYKEIGALLRRRQVLWDNVVFELRDCRVGLPVFKTRRQIADYLNISVRTYARWERGERVPRLHDIVKLRDMLWHHTLSPHNPYYEIIEKWEKIE